MTYKLVYKKLFKKKLKLLPKEIMFLVEHKVYKLKNFDIAKNVLDIKKLKWFDNLYRLRIWKYRVLFEKQDDKLVILLLDLGSRGDIYK